MAAILRYSIRLIYFDLGISVESHNINLVSINEHNEKKCGLMIGIIKETPL